METYITFISREFGFFVSIAKKNLPKHLQHLSEDIAQDAIILAIEKIEMYDSSKGNLKAWLYRITQNLCYDYCRRYNKIDIIPINNCEFKLVIDDVIDDSIQALKVQKIMRAISQLCKRDQELIRYKFLYNFSGKDLAELLGIPEKQINVYVKRAKDKLLIILNAA